MYKVRTVSGAIHSMVDSWKIWDLNDTFIEFSQKGDKLIINKNQIESIYK
jgi:hypothetical protein